MTAVTVAFGQTASAAPAGAEEASAQPSVTPEEARQALDVLQDTAKRDALIETLRTIAKTSTPAPSLPLTPTATPVPAADGFGAEALLQASAKIEEFSGQIAQSIRATTNFSLIWRWLVSTANDPHSQRLLVGFLWRFATVAGVALLAEYLVRGALRGPLASLQARAAHNAIQTTPVETRDDHGGTVRSNRRAIGLGKPLDRLQFAATRLLLEIAPVIAFAIIGNSLLATKIGAEPVARIAILALINAYVLFQSLMSVMRAFSSTKAPETSLFNLPGKTAAAIEIWMRSIVGAIVFGLALANVTRALGLNRPAYLALVGLVILVAHLLVVIVTLRCRAAVASFIRAPEGRGDFVSILRNRFAEVWHYLAIFANLVLWAVWALRIQNGYSLIVYYALATIVILAIARAASAAALGGVDRTIHLSSDFVSRYPNVEILANRYRPALHGAVSAIIAVVAAVTLLEVWGVDALAWFESGRIGASLVSEFSAVAIAITIALIIWDLQRSNGTPTRPPYPRGPSYARRAS